MLSPMVEQGQTNQAQGTQIERLSAQIEEAKHKGKVISVEEQILHSSLTLQATVLSDLYGAFKLFQKRVGFGGQGGQVAVAVKQEGEGLLDQKCQNSGGDKSKLSDLNFSKNKQPGDKDLKKPTLNLQPRKPSRSPPKSPEKLDPKADPKPDDSKKDQNAPKKPCRPSRSPVPPSSRRMRQREQKKDKEIRKVNQMLQEQIINEIKMYERVQLEKMFEKETAEKKPDLAPINYDKANQKLLMDKIQDHFQRVERKIDCKQFNSLSQRIFYFHMKERFISFLENEIPNDVAHMNLSRKPTYNNFRGIWTCISKDLQRKYDTLAWDMAKCGISETQMKQIGVQPEFFKDFVRNVGLQDKDKICVDMLQGYKILCAEKKEVGDELNSLKNDCMNEMIDKEPSFLSQRKSQPSYFEFRRLRRQDFQRRKNGKYRRRIQSQEFRREGLEIQQPPEKFSVKIFLDESLYLLDYESEEDNREKVQVDQVLENNPHLRPDAKKKKKLKVVAQMPQQGHILPPAMRDTTQRIDNDIDALIAKHNPKVQDKVKVEKGGNQNDLENLLNADSQSPETGVKQVAQLDLFFLQRNSAEKKKKSDKGMQKIFDMRSSQSDEGMSSGDCSDAFARKRKRPGRRDSQKSYADEVMEALRKRRKA